jgi:predicted ATPase
MFKSEIRDSTINALLEKTANRNYGRYLLKLVLKHVRGFSGEPVVFDFPVTALIGPNGGGKTTVMGPPGVLIRALHRNNSLQRVGSMTRQCRTGELSTS